MYKDSQFTSRDNTCFFINVIDRFVDLSVQENKYVDPFDRHIGTRIEKKDKVDKPLENYSNFRLDESPSTGQVRRKGYRSTKKLSRLLLRQLKGLRLLLRMP